MQKYMNWLVIISGMAAGCSLQAEMIITSPTGLSDESDVVLEKAVDAVKGIPSDTVTAIGDTAGFAADELRNTADGIASAFRGASARELAAGEMIRAVDTEWNASKQIQMRSYEVNEKMGQEIVQDAGSDGSVLDVRHFFMGIDFPEGASAYYRPDFKRLVVHQTPDNLQAIDSLMGRFNAEPDYRQVSIETKFIEVEQKALNELGFNWTFNDTWKLSDDWTADTINQTLGNTLRSSAAALPGSGASGTLVLTKDGWMPLSLAIRALEQSSGADTLSAPTVTTMDGKAAEIWVGDQEMMPDGFNDKSVSTSVFVEYTDWKKKNIGVYLSVTPEVVEKNMIDLELKPEVIDLVGYDTYSITPDNTKMMAWSGASSLSMSQTFTSKNSGTGVPIPNLPGMDWTYNFLTGVFGGADPNNTVYNNRFFVGNKGGYEQFGLPVPVLKGDLPVLRVRKIETNMTVADGSTVGMGGLIYDKIETYKDKVPVLGSLPLIGRLFRSEGQRSIKRNLMIFVTATQVDVDGRRASDLAVR